MEAESNIDNVINREIKTAMGKMQKFIDESVENIEISGIQSDLQAMDKVLIHEGIRFEAEELFTKLSTSMKEFTEKIYKKIYILSVQAVDEITESSGNLSAMPNPEKELMDKVDLWIKNLKNQVLDYINSAVDDTYF